MADFICFPTWLLHLFQYSNHGTVPGRTDIRFLENASIAKEDHIYRLNHVINSLFRFQLYSINYDQLENAIYLSNYLFNIAGLNPMELPRPHMMMTTTRHDGSYSQQQPSLYSSLIFLLHAPRPTKIKAMCYNCNSKPASRRQLCVACYRYQLKHNTPRPLRLIIANNPTSRPISSPIINNHDHNMKEFYSDLRFSSFSSSSISSISSLSSLSSQSLQQLGTVKTKVCVNCGVKETHQWYRNLCGHGHWCETCKSYYLRHGKVRPPELFIKAAKRKIDVRSWMDWSSWRSEG
ncbi:hypothetical protein BJ944DRAFT_209168 [Cunninghamella echinulata]|nr:hypothetical protein BJ944DRAFT_209168 [Cunninghamella echinulata]